MENITVDRLFRARKKVSLPGGEVWVRAISDFEYQSRYRQSMLERVRAERALRDPGSVDYLANIAPLETQTDEVLRGTIAIFWERELMDESFREIKARYIPFPDKATADEQAEVLKQREEQEKELPGKREEYVRTKLEERKAGMSDTSHEALVTEAKRLAIQAYLEGVFREENNYQTIMMSCEMEDGTPKFVYSEVRSLQRPVVNLLIRAFVEVNEIDPLALNGQLGTDTSTASSS